MIVAILALLTSLAIAAVAGYTSIIGLMALFSASAMTVGVIAGILEVAKLVTASWLYRNWKETSLSLKTYLTSAVIVLMLITSMGIFGFLSKAYLEQTQPVANNESKIERIDSRISLEQRKINDSEKIISQLDAAVDTLIEYDRIRGPSGAIAVRESQKDQRDLLNSAIQSSRDIIDSLEDEKFELNKEVLAVQAEIGPLKYVSALIYDNPEENIDNSVRIIILLLIFVFDPLAVLLLIAANQTFMRIADAKKENPSDTKESQGTSTEDDTEFQETVHDVVEDDGTQTGQEDIGDVQPGVRNDVQEEHKSSAQIGTETESEQETEITLVDEKETEQVQETSEGRSVCDNEDPKDVEDEIRPLQAESSKDTNETSSTTGSTTENNTSSESKSKAQIRKNVILAKLPSDIADNIKKNK